MKTCFRLGCTCDVYTMSAFVVADCEKNVFVWDVRTCDVYTMSAFVVADCEKDVFVWDVLVMYIIYDERFGCC